jgi:hypothetical protein
MQLLIHVYGVKKRRNKRQTDRQTDRHTETQTDRQTYTRRQTDRVLVNKITANMIIENGSTETQSGLIIYPKKMLSSKFTP